MNHARTLLERYRLAPKKTWGQNFLIDRHVQARIVDAAGVSPDDVVVEIGAGLGALTRLLLDRAARVIAIERDPDLIQVLHDEIGTHPRLELAALDAQAFNYARAAQRAGRPLVVLGNLPYQITSPLIFGLLAAAGQGNTLCRAILMMQKEVADRVRAVPGNKIYGRLSVMVQQQADVKGLFTVPPGAFLPQPSVVSAVIELVPRSAPLAPVSDPALFDLVVRMGFGGRRKMLRRALADGFAATDLMRAFALSGVAPTQRAEELSVVEFGRLSEALRGVPVLPQATDAAGEPDA